ncbi:MAG: tRNA 2-thiouridine(34) synthase MnmA [Armatimonadota bacterium]|nr:tRNA 2-thiouridine(34) synthase MnmA [Armatimonadota bacterium]
MSNTKQTVVVAMSGGVDSSVAAGLLLRQGYDVVGVTMQIWQESATETKGVGCCSLGAVEDARRVAAKLDIPHYVLNFREFFAEKVIENFVGEYKRGRTPNPCVNCNRYVKFDALLAKAQALGAEYLATGHYARVDFDEDARRWSLRRAFDRNKDQTYALYHFTQDELAHTLMPLGLVTNKAETRAIASELGLAVSDKPDSQEICFVQGGSYTDFLAQTAPETVQSGEIVDTSGKRRGTHDGIAFYTIGQRRRVNVGSPIPLYVVDINAETNTITVGGSQDLMASGLVADDINWVGISGVQESRPVLAKIRYNMEPVPGVVQNKGNDGSIVVHFDTPQRAVTPGQSLVLYDLNGESVLGGATIQRRL